MNVLDLGCEVHGRTFVVSAGPWPVLGFYVDRDGPETTVVVYMVFVTATLWWWKGALLRRLPDDEPTAQSDESSTEP